MNYTDRDTYGMYKNYDATKHSHSLSNQGPGPRLMGANTLIGNEVRNPKSEELGDIKEIMLDTETGRIAYAVMSFGGFLGMGEKLFAVPWGALTLDTNEKCFILDVDKKRLENAPGFDKDAWPNMADQSWTQNIHDFYKTTPYWEKNN